MIIYDILFIIFSLIYIPFSIYKKGLRSFNVRHRCGQGLKVGANGRSPLQKTIWLHAVSVGEVMALGGLIEKLRANPIVISVTTKAGYEVARRNYSQAATVIYSPFDLSFVLKRFFDAIRPRILIIAETEIWPNLIAEAKSRAVPIVIINGRISDSSFVRYNLAKLFLGPTLKRVDLFCMQSELDRERIISIGAQPAKVRVTGNMKFDILERRSARAPGRQFEGTLIVAGSTHKGEEEILIEVYKNLSNKFTNLKLLIAPRHVNRATQIKRLIKDISGISVLDTVGQLKDYYAIADIVFIGGSLVPHGGQNPLEAAYFSKPIIFGNSMFNFRDISQLLLQKGAAIQVGSMSALRDAVEFLINNPAKRSEMGTAAKSVIEENKGAANRNLELIKNFL